ASEELRVGYPILWIRLSGISVRPLSDYAVSIDWSVNQAGYEWGLPAPGGAKAFLEIGRTPGDLALVCAHDEYVQSQQLVVSNLEPVTLYWYRLTVVGTNDSGFTYVSSFVTQPVPSSEPPS